MQPYEDERAALEVGVEPHAVVGDGDVLDAADHGGDQRRVVLRAQHGRVHQHRAHDARDDEVEQELGVRPPGKLKYLTAVQSETQTHEQITGIETK